MTNLQKNRLITKNEAVTIYTLTSITKYNRY